jgi:hypothetical protein
MSLPAPTLAAGAVLVCLATAALADDTSPLERPEINFFGQVQLWNVITTGATDDQGEPVQDRWDAYIRRARLGLKGNVYPAITYQIVFAYDVIGKNLYTGGPGTPQGRDNRDFYLWDAFFTWSAHPRWANLTMGYFRPQVGRESITAAWQTNSFIKAFTNFLPRFHIVDSRPGRETGINIGGLYHAGTWGVNYNVGIFDADHAETRGNEAGTLWSPLVTARFAFTFGDAEMSRYRLGYVTNYWSQRRGVTLAWNYTHQGETDLFQSNTMQGVDVLANWGPLNVSGEYDLLYRERRIGNSRDVVYHARAGYNIHLPHGHILEPAYLYSGMEGEPASPTIPDETRIVHDAGVNWYVDRNDVRVNLHAVWQNGDRPTYYGLAVQLMFGP